MLPDWIDVSLLKGLSWVVLVGIALLMLFSIRMISSMVRKVVALVLLLGLAIGVWLYRDDLDNCRRTCSCSVAGFDVDFSDAAERECEAFMRATGG